MYIVVKNGSIFGWDLFGLRLVVEELPPDEI
jgi:hypothetical protein